MRSGKKEIQGILTVEGDTTLSGNLTQADVNRNEDNIMLNAFRIAINGSLSQFNMVDGIADEYEDESGIDTVNSTNEDYDATNDYYSPTSVGADFLHYKMNDNLATTNVIDTSGNDIHGTASANTSTLSVTGKINEGFEFTGTETVTFSDTGFPSGTSDKTISFWFKTSTNDAVYRTIFFYGKPGTTGHYIRIFLFSGKIGVTQHGDSHVFGSTSNDGNWHWACIFVDGSDYSITIDNGAATEKTMTTDLELEGGGFGGSAVYDNFIGCIDDLRLFTSVLSSGDRTMLYNSGSGTEDALPAAYNTMTLISDSFTAESQPDSARIILLEEDVDSITINTDLIAKVSRDGGTTWTTATLVDEGNYDVSKQILVATLDISGQPNGTTMEYKIETANSKNLKIHATGLSWGI